MAIVSKLDLYADLAIRTGVNLQPGQILVIGQDTFPVPLECVEFVRKLTKKAYEAGARQVYVNWEDPELNRIRLESATEESLDEYPCWKVQWMEEMVEQGAAFLAIFSPTPDLLSGIDPSRVARAAKAKASALRNFLAEYASFKVNYSILSIPTRSWANKLFPELSSFDAIENLWDIIFKIVRVDNENPILEWERHVLKLGENTQSLNSRQFKKLYYTAPGTNLTVELPERHNWVSLASVKNANNVPFLPNLPSEEIFSAPHKNGVNGTLSSTIPLYYNGTAIENLQLTFKDGRIIDYTADSGLETFKGIIETDEGSHYLGEVALVPIDSPISNYNMVFLNPLFDENASCHFAIGQAYPACIAEGQSMSTEQRLEHGLNQSIIHVDFMVGSNLLDIDGETHDGQRIPLFRQGKWVTGAYSIFND